MRRPGSPPALRSSWNTSRTRPARLITPIITALAAGFRCRVVYIGLVEGTGLRHLNADVRSLRVGVTRLFQAKRLAGGHSTRRAFIGVIRAAWLDAIQLAPLPARVKSTAPIT